MRLLALIGALLTMAAAGLAQPPHEGGESGPPRRLALVIGVSNYASLPRLDAVPQEVDLMNKVLTRANFQVTVVDRDKIGLSDLDNALAAFTEQVKPGDICFFYFTGYAAQDGEDDYLIPGDFNPATDTLHNNADRLRTVATNLGDKKAGLEMFFLEGARRIDAAISDAKPGLVIPDTTDLTEVLFGIPTAAGQYADAAPGQPGLFTQALAETIDKDGIEITRFMTEVLKSVIDRSNSRQQPSNGNKLTREFYFHPPKLQLVSRQNRIDREDYVHIPAGSFLMGCVPSDAKCDKSEKPQHEVTISKGFWMGQNEVRVASYRRFAAATKIKMPPEVDWNRKWQNDSHPISNMTWDDARAYCGWAGGRLPTEAEWEYAARDGAKDQIYPYDSDNSRDKANFAGREGGRDVFEYTAPVRYFDANAFGLYDMFGNVWEFVNDWYSPDYYATSPSKDPQGPAAGKQHVRRGGSFYSDPKKHLRISLREPSNAENNVGFRCVLDDGPETRRTLQIQ